MSAVAITGGCGFLGAALARHLDQHGVTLPSGQRLSNPDIILIDRAGATSPPDIGRYVPCDITNPDELRSAIPTDTVLIYHLAAVVSGQAEADFELGLRVNLDGTRHVLAAAAYVAPGAMVIGTSSLAVYGADAPEPLTERTATHPSNTYGVTKAMGELLMADYRRKGWLDARVLRLPTITVRPGKPNKAASSFVSGIIREPLAGVATSCPVPRDTKLWIASPDMAVAALHHAASVAPADWPRFGALNVPGITVTVDHMLDRLRHVAGADAANLVTDLADPIIANIVGNWPAVFDCSLALNLGFPVDADFDAILRQAMR